MRVLAGAKAVAEHRKIKRVENPRVSRTFGVRNPTRATMR
jgi:hypothetical protein